MIECFQPPATRLSERKNDHTLRAGSCVTSWARQTRNDFQGARPALLSLISSGFIRSPTTHRSTTLGTHRHFFWSRSHQVLHVHFKVEDLVAKRRIWHFRISNPSFEFCGLAQWSDNRASRNARDYWHGAEKGRYWTCWRNSVRNDLFAKINFKVKLVMRKGNDFKR